jgi:heat shock protein HslJ
MGTQYISGSKIAFGGLYREETTISIRFLCTGEFSGNTGCNSIRGKFHTHDTEIKFEEPIAMT